MEVPKNGYLCITGSDIVIIVKDVTYFLSRVSYVYN